MQVIGKIMILDCFITNIIFNISLGISSITFKRSYRLNNYSGFCVEGWTNKTKEGLILFKAKFSASISGKN